MALLGSNTVTILDVAKGLGPDGMAVAEVIELIAQQNDVLRIAPVIEANQYQGHLTTVRDGLASVYWRQANRGVPESKSLKSQVTETCGRAEGVSIVDEMLVEVNNNAMAFRASEDAGFVEAMNIEIAATLFYGNTSAAPEEFLGFAPRFSSLSAPNGNQIINAGGSGSDNTSIWLVGWSPRTCHLIYPKGTRGGLEMNDKGLEWIRETDAAGVQRNYWAWVTQFVWRIGLAVRDWRYVSRVANIDVSDLNTIANTENLITWMIQAAERIESFSGITPTFIVNRTIREKLRLGIIEKIASNLTWETVAGRRVMMFDDIEVLVSDALLNTEAVVS